MDTIHDENNCVLAYGHFNTIHAGHIRYLRHARSLGNYLVVALIGDGNSSQPSPYPFKQDDRAEALKLLGIADKILPLHDNDLVESVKSLKPSVLVLGTELKTAEHLIKPIEIVKQQGGTVHFHAGDITYATTELLDTPEADLLHSRRHQFVSSCYRQGIYLSDLVASMDAWSKARLVVLGDTIVDQYSACEALGMSAEAPVVVVRELAKKNFIGAAAIVAAHIRTLGAQVDLVSVVGQDSKADYIKAELKI